MCIFMFSLELSRFAGTVTLEISPLSPSAPTQGIGTQAPRGTVVENETDIDDINHPAFLGVTQLLPLWLQALKCRKNLPLLRSRNTPDATSSVFSAFRECIRFTASPDEADDLTVESEYFLNF